jgi:hypothetical protein
MERFPVELVYLIIFAAFILFNWLSQQAARRRQQEEQARAEEFPQAGPPEEEEPFEDIWTRPVPEPVPAPAPAPVMVARPSPPPLRQPAGPVGPLRLHPARALLRDKRDLRRAVVLVMVLGPCRAQQSHEER